MLLDNLDIICRKWLLERGMPIHFYFEALVHAATATKILAEDTLQIINSANLPVGNYGEVDLPDDFDDDLAVCIPSGQALIQLPKQDWLTPIRIHDTDSGEFVPYSQQTQNTENIIFPGNSFGFAGWGSYYWNVDSYNGNLGRQFGMTGGTKAGYKVVRERRQIQMTEGFRNTNVVLLYLSDGQRADNASQIDTKASICIRSYISWKSSPNRDIERSPEAMSFYNQKRRLKTLLSDLTKADILNVFRSGYTASIKT